MRFYTAVVFFAHNPLQRSTTQGNAMALTNVISAALINRAVADGQTLTIDCPNGDKLTVSSTEVLRWGKSEHADPWGRVIVRNEFGVNAGKATVAQCGRGLAARSARKALGT